MQDEAKKWLTPEAAAFAERVATCIDDAIGRSDQAPRQKGDVVHLAFAFL